MQMLRHGKRKTWQGEGRALSPEPSLRSSAVSHLGKEFPQSCPTVLGFPREWVQSTQGIGEMGTFLLYEQEELGSMMSELLILVFHFFFSENWHKSPEILHFLNLKAFCFVVLLFGEGSFEEGVGMNCLERTQGLLYQ